MTKEEEFRTWLRELKKKDQVFLFDESAHDIIHKKGYFVFNADEADKIENEKEDFLNNLGYERCWTIIREEWPSYIF